MTQIDRRPTQIVPVLTPATNGGFFSSCYPAGELRYIGPRAKSGYRHGRIYDVHASVSSFPAGHPFHARDGEVTVYDQCYGESMTKPMPPKKYVNFEEFCKEWENPE